MDNTSVSTEDFKKTPSFGPAASSNSSQGLFFPYIDKNRNIRRPTDVHELREYKRIPYVCANINATTVAEFKPRLFVTTNATQRKPRVPTKPVSRKQFIKLEESGYLEKQFSSVEEVISHPLLTLLSNVNDDLYFNSYKLREVTQLYQEITGKAYWFLEFDSFGRPEQIWVLPSHLVCGFREPSSKKQIDVYRFQAVDGIKLLNPKDVIEFLLPSLNNPYTDGMSPLEAGWESSEVSNSLISHERGLLDNEARPDALLTSDDGFGPDEAENFERKFMRKFGFGRGGGVWAVAEPNAKFTPISWPPRDMARLEISKWSKLEIANCFGIPIALLESQSINRATLEGAQVQHGRYAIRPRLERSSAVLNKRLIPFYDNSGRLFLQYDNPVPEDRAAKTQEHVGLVGAGIETANEARHEYDLPPHPDGNKLESANAIKEKDGGDTKRPSDN